MERGTSVTIEGVTCEVRVSGPGWVKVVPEGRRVARVARWSEGEWRWSEIVSPTETKRTR
jgi:hypothetical protein